MDPGPGLARAPAQTIPYAPTLIALEEAHFAAIQRTVRLLFGLAHSPAYRARVDADAPALARHEPGNFGVFMGYDFHLTAAGPRLIEINSNAGGALLNGLHTAALCDPAKLACLCRELLPVEAMLVRIWNTFVAEFAAARGPGAPLRSIAIADEKPHEQFLYAEFELFRELFEGSGARARICDTGELRRGENGRLELASQPIDLVYLRDTDFLLGAPRSRELREAYLARSVVVTPSPREHYLLANKRRFEIFGARDTLLQLGVAPEDASFLATIVPETHGLESVGLERAWRERRALVFKPEAAFGSRGVYRGDKISRRKLEEIETSGGFLAQQRVEPAEIEVATAEGVCAMKFDVRAYCYRDEVLLLGARVYRGQVTNLRTPGGGFCAICVVRDPASGSRA